MENKRLICLYAHYNPQGKISPEVVFSVRELASVGFEVAFISNSEVGKEYKEELIQAAPGCRIFERPNKGNDFGAWKWALENSIVPDDANGLLLTNDSVFGPLFPLGPILDYMNSNHRIDYWGMTDSYQGTWHIQSYFLYFHRKVFTSEVFKSFFTRDFEKLSKKEVIDNGEIALSQLLKKSGCHGEALVSYEKLLLNKRYTDLHNPTHFFWKELILQYRFPYLKKDLVLSNPENFPNITDLFTVVEERTEYPVSLLKAPFIARFSTAPRYPLPMRVMVVCHIFFPDLAFELIEKLVPLRGPNAIFIFNISSRLNANSHFRDILKKIFPQSYIISTPNKGRDIGGKLSCVDLAFKLNIESDITLIIHDKKSQHLEGGEFWRNELFKVIEKDHLKKVVAVFQGQENTGIVASRKFIQNEYNVQSKSFQCTSNERIKELLKKFSIAVSNYDFVAGNIFWIRTELLKQFFATRSIFLIKEDLEKGNALDFGNGTYIHSWERISSWIASNLGYKIYGI